MNHDQQHEPKPWEYDSDGRDAFGRPIVTQHDVDVEPEAETSFANLTEAQRMKFVELQHRITKLENKPRVERRIIEAQLIERLLKAGTAEQIGRKILLTAYHRKLLPERTLSELAARLGKSKTWTHRRVKEVETDLGAHVVASCPDELP